ncbi:MAG: restriction endonuclease [Bacteroidetes bacterium]|nr:restriction endonuclease [Bacteroidota bacterium]
MISLFEYNEWKSIKNKDDLLLILQGIWKQRLFVDSETETIEEQNDKRFQPFLNFDGNEIRANNYVGFIQNDEEVIEIYPKVFRNTENAIEKKELMLQHIFYWFSYCRKWKFPFNKASLDTKDIFEFPELIINLMANQFLETVSKQPLTIYQQLEEALQTPRGSINFKRYINNSFSHGNFQNIDCDYEPFLFDNKINRIIKYCSRLLLNQTKFYENQRMLQEVIFILDEVDDQPYTLHDIERITFNSFFEDYSILMDSCKLILSQQLYSNNTYDLSQWCLLFPMEYIFEDFFAGFLEEKFQKEWKVEYQKSEKYLATNEEGKNVFNMQHDIFLTLKENPDLKVIVDTKYKLRPSSFKTDLKKGIEQNDLYQMVSYAFKRGCTDILLVYPNLSETLNHEDKFEIDSGFPLNEKINVTAIEIPFWSFTNFYKLETEMEKSITKNLNDIKQKNQLTKIIL